MSCHYRAIMQPCKRCGVTLDVTNSWKSKKNPARFHTYCKKCNNELSYKTVLRKKKENPEIFRIYAREWRRKNPERARARNRLHGKKLKMEILTHYSNGKPYCVCCLESEINFLTLDHIGNDGARHREKISGKKRHVGGSSAGAVTYYWVKKNNFPKLFQVMCMNCNWGKRITGVCPHKMIPLIHES